MFAMSVANENDWECLRWECLRVFEIFCECFKWECFRLYKNIWECSGMFNNILELECSRMFIPECSFQNVPECSRMF